MTCISFIHIIYIIWLWDDMGRNPGTWAPKVIAGLWMVIPPNMVEGSLEVKLPTIWTDEKQSRQREEKD